METFAEGMSYSRLRDLFEKQNGANTFYMNARPSAKRLNVEVGGAGVSLTNKHKMKAVFRRLQKATSLNLKK